MPNSLYFTLKLCVEMAEILIKKQFDLREDSLNCSISGTLSRIILIGRQVGRGKKTEGEQPLSKKTELRWELIGRGEVGLISYVKKICWGF